jgi:hypothetical protein
MNKEALIRLADKLQGNGPYEKAGPIPICKFDMSTWIQSFIGISNFTKYISGVGNVMAKEVPCGTAACACGWAGSDPWFQERGFYCGPGLGIFYKCSSDFNAVAKFFDIDYYTSRYLFYPNSMYDQTPNGVAMRIREVVRIDINQVTGI